MKHTHWEVALSADGRRLYAVTGSPEPGVRVLTVLLEDAIALAQSRVTRTLSTDECRQYLHLESCPEQ
ncbi:MAG: hypothetical protein KDE48_20085 [Anaerolineales bacterium]|nr:hypothetical protein [Anaerolineales bacterium]